MGRGIHTLFCNSINDIPSVEEIRKHLISHTLNVIFGNDIVKNRASIGELWAKNLENYSIEAFPQDTNIMIRKFVTEEEIITYQAIFEGFAKEYRDLATKLITNLSERLNFSPSKYGYLESYNTLKDGRQRGSINGWGYFIHGNHCQFINKISAQEIEVSLNSGEDFGVLDPCFFVMFIKTSKRYASLPLPIYEEYEDGVKIINKMIELGRFERVRINNKNFIRLREIRE